MSTMENEGKTLAVVRKFPFELNLTDPLAQNLVPLTPLAKCWRPRRSRFNGSSRSSSNCGNFAEEIHFERRETGMAMGLTNIISEVLGALSSV